MHSEGILAGELKHGPLALVDKLMPVIMIIMRDHTYVKCQNALQQVVARQVRPIHTHTPQKIRCNGYLPNVDIVRKYKSEMFKTVIATKKDDVMSSVLL